MAILRKVFGPFAPELKHPEAKELVELSWYFFGIRGDGDMSHWVLTYDPRKRTFLASNTGTPALAGARYRVGLRELGIKAEAGDCIHPKMFIEGDTSLTMDDKVTDILRQKLPASEIAKVTALTIRVK